MTNEKKTNPTARREAVEQCRAKQEEIKRLLNVIEARVDIHTRAAMRSPDPDAPWSQLGDLSVVERHLKKAFDFIKT